MNRRSQRTQKLRGEKCIRIELEFGDGVLSISVPETADILPIPSSTLLPNPSEFIRHSLLHPIGTAGLPFIIRKKKREKTHLKAVVVVSDNTRPVPYTGDNGILEPVLDILVEQGVKEIEILVATGIHRPMSEKELRQILPRRVFQGDMVLTNHQCTDQSSLRHIGRTARGTEVWINRHFLDADIKILTGLAEPHFMAGVSGGRKSVCPGLIGESATNIFHGADIMADIRADSLIVEGNPCHEEAMEMARMTGVDFMINVTLDRKRRLTGVYSGDMEQAHMSATAKVIETSAILIRHEYDLVITHAGFVGINHYQSAKAGVEAVKAAKNSGSLIIAANNTDSDPIGSHNYKQVLPLLKQYGVDGFTRKIMSPDWTFIPEQWEVQMWARVIRKLIRFDNLIYCSSQLTGSLFRESGVPGNDGGEGIHGLSGRALTENMVQSALDSVLAANPGASIAVLPDGPYGVPVLRA